MADDELTGRRPTPSDDAPVEDLRGEELVTHLPETDAEPYQIDDPTAEELVEAPTEPDEMVHDADQLEDATLAAEHAPSSRPRKREGGAVALEEPATTADGGAVVARAATRPRKISAGAEVEKKDHATPRQRKTAEREKKDRPVGPATFIKQCVAELKQVVWPTGEQLSQYFIVVLVFVLFIILYVSLIDAGMGALLLKLLG